ncbi:MAG TPA: flagellar motor switch protein FliM [Actinomycetes bacterium]|nr:flagellar motor switch protein FliM [Actinomycetes bacterium]
MSTAANAPALGTAAPSRASRTGRAGRRSRGAGPQLYDFRRPTKLSREHVRSLQILCETFGRRWSTLLTTSLRAVCGVSLLSIEQLTYDEYVSALSTPTVMNLLSVEPIPGTGVIEISLPSAMATIDHLLGGPGGENQPARHLTEIETALLHGVLTRVLGELTYAFESLLPMRPELTGIEYNPQFAQAAAASDMVIVASFEMRIGALESVATLCLPFAGVVARLESSHGHGVVTDRERRAREQAAVALASGLETVPVDVSVRFQPVPLTPAELVALAVGDVLPLRHPTSAPLAVTAADVVFAHAVPGSQGKRLACLVVEPPEGEASA